MNGKLTGFLKKLGDLKTVDTSRKEIKNNRIEFKKILSELSLCVGDSQVDRLCKNYFSKQNIFLVLESPHARLTALSGHSVNQLVTRENSAGTGFYSQQTMLPEWSLDGDNLLIDMHYEDEVYARPNSYEACISPLVKVLKARENNRRFSGAIIYLHQNDLSLEAFPVWLNKMASFVGVVASTAKEAIPVYIVLESADNTRSPIAMLKDKGVATEQFTQWYLQAKEEISKRLLNKTLEDVQYVHNVESRRLAFSELNVVEQNLQQLRHISEQLNQRWNFTDKQNAPWVRGVFIAPHAVEISESSKAINWWQSFSHQLVQDRYCCVTEKSEAKYKQWSVAGLMTVVGMASLFLCQLVWRDYAYASQLSDRFSEQLIPQYVDNTHRDALNLKTVLTELEGIELIRKDLEENNSERAEWSSSLSHKVVDQGTIILDKASENILRSQFGAELNQTLLHTLEFSDEFETLYPALKSYLLFHTSKDERFDYLMWWFGRQWQEAYKNEPESRQQLARYLSFFLQNQGENKLSHNSYEYDESVVSIARAKMLAVPLYKRLYLQIKQEAYSKQKSTSALKDVIGYSQAEVFGQSPLAVSSFYTDNGYKTLFLPSLHRVLKQASTDEWILGFADNDEQVKSDVDTLKDDIYKQYIDDYIAAWDTFLKSLSIATTTSFDHFASLLKASSGNDGAIRRVLQYTYDNTAQYSVVSGVVNDVVSDVVHTVVAGIDNKSLKNSVANSSQTKRAAGYLSEQNIPSVHPMKKVTEHFYYLNTVQENSANKAAVVDDIDAQIHQLDEYLLSGSLASNDLFDATVARVSGNRNNPISLIKRTSKMMPKPLSGWAYSFSHQAWGHMIDGTKQHIKNAYKNDIYPLYTSNIKSKYPLNRQSHKDVELDHFSDYFKPEGEEQRFFNQYIKPFVRTGNKRWSERKIGGLALGFTRDYLAQLHRAQNIRETMFKDQSIFAELQFQPIYLDANISRFDLDLMGERLNYRHGPQKVSTITWPADVNSTAISMRFEDYHGGLATDALSGEWSLFKLIDEYGKETMPGGKRYRMSFEVNGQRAVYSVTGRRLTPGLLSILSKYRMPERPLG